MTESAQLRRKMYRAMLAARRFDEAQIAFYKTGREPMESVHSYIGQEAIGIGAGFAMRARATSWCLRCVRARLSLPWGCRSRCSGRACSAAQPAPARA